MVAGLVDSRPWESSGLDGLTLEGKIDERLVALTATQGAKAKRLLVRFRQDYPLAAAGRDQTSWVEGYLHKLL
jgi:hypothetical protein